MRRWIVGPRFVKDRNGLMVHDHWQGDQKWEEIPDHEAVDKAAQLLDDSPVWLEDETKWMRDEYPINQVWYRHPDHIERVIGVELQVPRAGYTPAYLHSIIAGLQCAKFRPLFGTEVFPIYGAGGGITSRCYFPVLDRKGSAR